MLEFTQNALRRYKECVLFYFSLRDDETVSYNAIQWIKSRSCDIIIYVIIGDK